MGTVVKGLFRHCIIKWQPQLQLVRCKTKVSVTRPRPPHFQRALLENVCKPFFKTDRLPPHLPDFLGCTALAKKQLIREDHPLKIILANECLNRFENSRMIAFFHMNSFNPEEKFQCQLMLKKAGMKLFIFSKIIIKKAFTGTKYENIIKLYDAPTATALGPDNNIHGLLKVVKRLPKLLLFGGIVDGRLLSLTELQYYGKLESITDARLTLLSTLNAASQNLVQQINHHPSNVVQLLNQHKKVLQGQSA